MTTVKDILDRHNSISNNTLIGVMNSENIENINMSEATYLGQITLLRTNWVNNGENGWIYKYINPKINTDYYLEITPIVEGDDVDALKDAEIQQWIELEQDLETNSSAYKIFAKNRPTIDIQVNIFAIKIHGEL